MGKVHHQPLMSSAYTETDTLLFGRLEEKKKKQAVLIQNWFGLKIFYLISKWGKKKKSIQSLFGPSCRPQHGLDFEKVRVGVVYDILKKNTNCICRMFHF